MPPSTQVLERNILGAKNRKPQREIREMMAHEMKQLQNQQKKHNSLFRTVIMFIITPITKKSRKPNLVERYDFYRF